MQRVKDQESELELRVRALQQELINKDNNVKGLEEEIRKLKTEKDLMVIDSVLHQERHLKGEGRTTVIGIFLKCVFFSIFVYCYHFLQPQFAISLSAMTNPVRIAYRSREESEEIEQARYEVQPGIRTRPVQRITHQ